MAPSMRLEDVPDAVSNGVTDDAIRDAWDRCNDPVALVRALGAHGWMAPERGRALVELALGEMGCVEPQASWARALLSAAACSIERTNEILAAEWHFDDTWKALLRACIALRNADLTWSRHEILEFTATAARDLALVIHRIGVSADAIRAAVPCPSILDVRTP